MLKELGIDEDLEKLTNEVEEEIKEQFKNIEKISEKNSLKVLNAFQECNLQEMHLNSPSPIQSPDGKIKSPDYNMYTHWLSPYVLLKCQIQEN